MEESRPSAALSPGEQIRVFLYAKSCDNRVDLRGPKSVKELSNN